MNIGEFVPLLVLVAAFLLVSKHEARIGALLAPVTLVKRLPATVKPAVVAPWTALMGMLVSIGLSVWIPDSPEAGVVVGALTGIGVRELLGWPSPSTKAAMLRMTLGLGLVLMGARVLASWPGEPAPALVGGGAAATVGLLGGRLWFNR